MTKKIKDVSSSFTFEKALNINNRTLSLTFFRLSGGAPHEHQWSIKPSLRSAGLDNEKCVIFTFMSMFEKLFSSLMIERLFENIYCLKVFIHARNCLIERNFKIIKVENGIKKWLHQKRFSLTIIFKIEEISKS
jgi:hypothetical protein